MKVIVVTDEGLDKPLVFGSLDVLLKHVDEGEHLSPADRASLVRSLQLGMSWADKTTSYDWQEVSDVIVDPVSDRAVHDVSDQVVYMAFRKVREDAIQEFREELQKTTARHCQEIEEAMNTGFLADAGREVVRWNSLNGAKGALVEMASTIAKVAEKLRLKKPYFGVRG